MSQSLRTRQPLANTRVDEVPRDPECTAAAAGNGTAVDGVMSTIPTVLVVPAESPDVRETNPKKVSTSSSDSDSYDLVSVVRSKDPSSLDIVCLRTRCSDDTRSSSSYEDLSCVAVRSWSPCDSDDDLSDVQGRNEVFTATITMTSSGQSSAVDGRRSASGHATFSPARLVFNNRRGATSTDGELNSYSSDLMSSCDCVFVADDSHLSPEVSERSTDDSGGSSERLSDVVVATSTSVTGVKL
ncbi:hypothetical protein NP493_1694g00018 [Ridgeia piscesae]|uniref:Uncharacterized protein n=1 Tax=Ridgeia piscesae TaxID=27915 RepID=A0AAD9JVQ5_RIDPI|nr:hypothetical protein NP493_1694g00018 [Ridgeia piscesae]